MVGWICAGYGLLAGLVFFVYLCWFMHVRDHVEGRGKRILYYFLIAVTFSLVGKVVGISPILGVVPMLILMSFLPKDRIGYVVACSLAFGAILGIVIYVGVVGMTKGTGRAGPGRELASSSSSSKFDLDKYFVSDAFDPAMEFDDPLTITVGENTVLLPVPKGCQWGEETAGGQVMRNLYTNTVVGQKVRMILIIPSRADFTDDDPIVALRRARIELFTTATGDATSYRKYITSGLTENGAMITDPIGPSMEQNTKYDAAMFFSCSFTIGDKTASFSVIESAMMFSHQFFEMVMMLSAYNGEDNKRFGVTWLKNFMTINHVETVL